MRCTLALLLFVTSGNYSSAGRIVCYFLSWTIYRSGDGKFEASNVEPSLCTHIIYVSVGLNPDMSVQIPDDWETVGLPQIQQLQDFKVDYPDLKVMISVAGSEVFSPIAADPELRATFAEQMNIFLETYQLDGLEVDWQYPNQGDDAVNFVLLLNELKEVLSENELILAASVSGQYSMIESAYPIPENITKTIDFLNMKTLDYHGSWEDVTGHYAPLYPANEEPQPYQNIHTVLMQWIRLRADKYKINFGLGSYGRTFTLQDPESNDINAPAVGSGQLGPLTQEEGIWGFNEICSVFDNFTEVVDDFQAVPHRFLGNQWVGFDDVMSTSVKVWYVNLQGMLGVSFYSLDTDDFLGRCSNITFPLLRMVNDVLY